MISNKLMNIINVLEKSNDEESINVLKELGTESPNNEVREYTAKALVNKNTHDSLEIVLMNEGKGLNDLSPVVAMGTINAILDLEDKTEVMKILDDTIKLNSIEKIRENARALKELILL